MDFSIVQQVSAPSGLARVGRLSLGDTHVVETPDMLLHTRIGHVPHLTRDLWPAACPSLAACPATRLIGVLDALKVPEAGGLAHWARLELPAQRLPAPLLLLTQSDTSRPYQLGGHNNKAVCVWGSAGRVRLEPEAYVALAAACRAPLLQALVDNETPPDAGAKRCSKAVERTLSLLDRLLAVLPVDAPQLWASLAGGRDARQRERCAEEVLQRVVAAPGRFAGFVLDGFHDFRRSPLLFELVACEDLVAELVRRLPADRPRLLTAVAQPADLVTAAVDCGVDLFDGTLPLLLTERRVAWCRSDAACSWLDLRRRRVFTASRTTGFRALEMAAEGAALAKDLRPLQVGCDCLACRCGRDLRDGAAGALERDAGGAEGFEGGYSRAYLVHLLATKEMLLDTLLMAHNVTQCYAFCAELRQAMRAGGATLEAFRAGHAQCRVPYECLVELEGGDGDVELPTGAEGVE